MEIFSQDFFFFSSYSHLLPRAHTTKKPCGLNFYYFMMKQPFITRSERAKLFFAKTKQKTMKLPKTLSIFIRILSGDVKSKSCLLIIFCTFSCRCRLLKFQRCGTLFRFLSVEHYFLGNKRPTF
jgi:hypothetical protein